MSKNICLLYLGIIIPCGIWFCLFKLSIEICCCPANFTRKCGTTKWWFNSISSVVYIYGIEVDSFFSFKEITLLNNRDQVNEVLMLVLHQYLQYYHEMRIVESIKHLDLLFFMNKLIRFIFCFIYE